MRKSQLALLFIFFIVIVFGGAVLFGTLLWVQITERYRGYSVAERTSRPANTASTGR
jgi:hypothetical protein